MKPTRGREVAITAGGGGLVLIALVGWTFWCDIQFFIRFESRGPNAQGYAEYRHRDSGIVFVMLSTLCAL